MNYETFKKAVEENILSYMPREYRNSRAVIKQITKVNVMLDALNIIMEDISEFDATPTIYLNDMYKEYLKTEDIQEVLEKAAEVINYGLKNSPKVVIDFNTAKNNIVFQLVNTNQNKEMFSNIPNRAFMDLSIIYRWVVENHNDSIQSTVIHSSLASFSYSDAWGWRIKKSCGKCTNEF